MADISAAEARVARFAERVAQRDTPPVPDPHRFEPPQVLARLVVALRPLTGVRLPLGARTLARMCLAFLDAPELSGAALTQAAGVGKEAGYRARVRLAHHGLLQHRYVDRSRRYRLTRFGEDWLLAVAQDTEVPAPPVIG